MNPQQDFVLKTIKGRDVHFVRFWFTDVLGTIKSFSIIPSELESAFESGKGFDASRLCGLGVGEYADMLAFPDASTFQVLPWRPDSNAVARMFCNLRTPDGRLAQTDPRMVLQKVCNRASEMGFVFYVSPELEYYYFKDANGTEVLDRGGFLDYGAPLDFAYDLRRDTVLTLEKMGIPVEHSYHECGPSQHEIDLRSCDAVSMADAVITYKLAVKEVATKYGVFASFMPKPLEHQHGNSMHVHMSLLDVDGNNLFMDENDPEGYCLSSLAKHFLAGVLRYAPEYCLITNQTINSYRRLVPQGDAPISVTWSQRNHATMVRVPGYNPESPLTYRFEIHTPDSAANPYLALAAILASGLKGIEEELVLQAPTEDPLLSTYSRKQLAELGYVVLPETLGEAVESFEASDLMRETLGEPIFNYLAEMKRAEWDSYLSHVSSWELDHYLAVL